MDYFNPVGYRIDKVYIYLRRKLQPRTTAQILKSTGINLDNDKEVFESLCDEESRVVRVSDTHWRWKSAHPYVHNMYDLKSLLKQNLDGIQESELLETYRGVRKDLRKLEEDNEVYIMNGVVYWRDRSLEIEIDDDVKERYNSVQVPDAVEVRRYLVEHGMVETDQDNIVAVNVVPKRKRPRKKGRKRSRTRRSVTNRHMQGTGINLDVDYDGKE